MNYAPYADYPLSTTDTGIAFRYAPARNLDSVPIVLLHGLSQQGDYWLPVIESLGSEHAIVSIDLNGHGESRRLKSDYQVSSVSKDCVSVLDQLEIDQACVVGHSWGASVALHFAANFADRTHSAVLVDGGAFTPANILNRGSISRERLRVELTHRKAPSQNLNCAHIICHRESTCQWRNKIRSCRQLVAPIRVRPAPD